MACALDDQPGRFGVELDFIGEIRFIEQRLRDSDPVRIADPDDAGLHRHCDLQSSYTRRSSRAAWVDMTITRTRSATGYGRRDRRLRAPIGTVKEWKHYLENMLSWRA